jgi:ubiquinone biosynthesis protein
MQIQPQLILLQKTLFNIEGLGRQLYPQLDLWKTAHPILRQWMSEQLGPKAAFEQLREDLPQIRDALRELPGVVKYLSQQIADDNLQLNLHAPELDNIRDQLQAQRQQNFALTVAASASISGALVLTLTSAVWAGWALVVIGVAAAVAGRPRQ